MAGGTGVGGIKDSQGNYSIVAQGDSTLGTRSGTLSVPLGDVVGQKSGKLAVTALTRTDTPDDAALSLSVSSFVPGNPPSAPTPRMTFSLGTEQDSVDTRGVFSFADDGVPLLALKTEAFVDGDRPTLTVAPKVVFFDSTWVIPNAVNFSGVVVMESMFYFTTGSGAGPIDFVAPFSGTFTDVVVLINAPGGSVTLKVNGSLVSTLSATPDFVRRATSFVNPSDATDPICGFSRGDTLTVTVPVHSNSVIAKVFFVRTQSPL